MSWWRYVGEAALLVAVGIVFSAFLCWILGVL